MNAELRAAVEVVQQRGIDAEEAWAADMLYGAEPSAAPHTETLTVDTDIADGASDPGNHASPSRVGDETVVLADAPPPDEPRDVNAGAKKTAIVLGAGLALAVAVIVTALVSFNGTAAPPGPRPAPVAASAAPVPITAAPPPDQDQAVPFTASANCPPGSTSAQALADTTSDSAWVCVRGGQGAAVDGQVLRIDLGRSYVLSAVSVTPGWVAKTPGGKDEWLQHRVVTRLQYLFNDVDNSIFTQDAGNTHGPVTTPLPKKVLASRITVVVLQTARPLASPMPADGVAPAHAGFGDSMLGPDIAPISPDGTATSEPAPLGEQDPDPADATFAMSALKFFGHEPN
jgi:hypothetical protein